MREIKFRAMNETGGWVYFSIWGINPPLNQKKLKHLCQFIGLKDKNGNEIYSDDIIKDGINIMKVGYCDTFASFCLIKKGWMHNHFFDESVNPEECEVIGNIHSNPEMMEVYE